MQEQVGTTTKQAYADLPACCGTGCAVCVLDLVDERVAEAAPAPKPEAGACLQPSAHVVVECCNTGCLICVRDYPELFRAEQPDAATLQLLEAMEQAQQTVG